MGRNRISPERAIQIYGSLEKYELHCQYMKDYNIKHAEEQAAWREEHKEHLADLCNKWRNSHMDEYKQKSKQRRMRRKQADPEAYERKRKIKNEKRRLRRKQKKEMKK